MGAGMACEIWAYTLKGWIAQLLQVVLSYQLDWLQRIADK